MYTRHCRHLVHTNLYFTEGKGMEELKMTFKSQACRDGGTEAENSTSEKKGELVQGYWNGSAKGKHKWIIWASNTNTGLEI